jgi:hypothetical protein
LARAAAKFEQGRSRSESDLKIGCRPHSRKWWGATWGLGTLSSTRPWSCRSRTHIRGAATAPPLTFPSPCRVGRTSSPSPNHAGRDPFVPPTKQNRGRTALPAAYLTQLPFLCRLIKQRIAGMARLLGEMSGPCRWVAHVRDGNFLFVGACRIDRGRGNRVRGDVWLRPAAADMMSLLQVLRNHEEQPPLSLFPQAGDSPRWASPPPLFSPSLALRICPPHALASASAAMAVAISQPTTVRCFPCQPASRLASSARCSPPDGVVDVFARGLQNLLQKLDPPLPHAPPPPHTPHQGQHCRNDKSLIPPPGRDRASQKSTLDGSSRPTETAR